MIKNRQVDDEDVEVATNDDDESTGIDSDLINHERRVVTNLIPNCNARLY